MNVNEIEKLISKATDQVIERLQRERRENLLPIAILRQISDYPKEIVDSVDEKVNWVPPDLSASYVLLVNSISLQQLVAIANLQTIDYATSIINQFLLAGKPVWILACEVESNQFRTGVKYGLAKRIREVFDRVISFGVDFGFDPLKVEKLSKDMNKKREESGKIPDFITEKKLMELVGQSDTVELKKTSQLTPLAMDYIREKRITVQYC